MGPTSAAAGDAAPGAGVAPLLQERSRRSYHLILEATAELLADRPFDEITIDEIVERAGYTKGAFYGRFDSKGTLLRHLVDRLTDGAVDAWAAFLDPDRWEGEPLRAVLEATVRRLVAIYTRSGHVMRAFGREVQLGGDGAVRETAARLNGRVADRFVALVEARRDELAAHARANPAAEARYWLATLIAVLRTELLWPEQGLEVEASAAEREARAIRLLVPYLTG